MTAQAAAHDLSVIVPFHDKPEQLERCLAALRASTVPFELIAVDDASRGARAPELARAAADRVLTLERNSGPAVARNVGARHARGSLLVFIDADVVVEPDTLARMQRELESDPTAAALFGSYDDDPADRSTVSYYRNLLHHWVHHQGPREASTFWAGCGAIRRAAFERVGGFDESYTRPSIEDIELGMRLKAAGERILLVPQVRCKHLKRWGLVDMVTTDVTRRAIPWTKLLLDRPGTGGDLNLQWKQKLCVALVLLALVALPACALSPELRALWAPLWGPLVLLAPVLVINRGLYALFLARRGPLFALAGIALHLLYFAYSGFAYAWVRLTHRRKHP
jgi:glycosyltransferase involved in cell wall biosynthesis